jgi:hypothetical protein
MKRSVYYRDEPRKLLEFFVHSTWLRLVMERFPRRSLERF